MENSISPAEANWLFEVLAPEQPEAAEQAEVRSQFWAVQWLGDFQTECRLESSFAVGNAYPGTRPLEPEFAAEIISKHLTHLSLPLFIIRDACRATAVLAEMAQKYSDRPILRQKNIEEDNKGEGYCVGQFLLHATDSGIIVADNPAFSRSHRAPELLRLDRDDGVLFIRTDSQERYNAAWNGGNVAVTEETIISLDKSDPGYFASLHEAAQQYLNTLDEVIKLAGFDPKTLIDPSTDKLDYSKVRNGIEPAIAQLYTDNGIPQEILGRMGGWLAVIWEGIRLQSQRDPYTQKFMHYGIRAAGHRTSTYFKALLAQSPKAGNF